MLSTPNVTSHAVRAQGTLPSATGAAPETEGFDFMTYLLGLQVNPQSESIPNGASGLSSLIRKASQEGGEDPVLALFQKNQKGGWNPMFPNLGAGAGSQSGSGTDFPDPGRSGRRRSALRQLTWKAIRGTFRRSRETRNR